MLSIFHVNYFSNRISFKWLSCYYHPFGILPNRLEEVGGGGGGSRPPEVDGSFLSKLLISLLNHMLWVL